MLPIVFFLYLQIRGRVKIRKKTVQKLQIVMHLNLYNFLEYFYECKKVTSYISENPLEVIFFLAHKIIKYDLPEG